MGKMIDNVGDDVLIVPSPKPDHSGHRERIRARVYGGELPCGTDDELLEVLLFYAIPRGDTRPMAEELINRFGSLRGVANATKEQLMSVKGVGEKTAILIQTACLMARKTPMPEETVYLNTYEEKCDFFCNLLSSLPHEEVWAASLSEKGQLLDITRLSRGTKAGARFSHRTILNAVLSCGAAAVILAHNHPDGSARPSADDILTTRAVSDLLSRVACRLEEHVVVCGDKIITVR
ncbi:MAG: RadC family protein [Clostridia bacterium]|nr:RadC family protein [Clostridia bacterium]